MQGEYWSGGQLRQSALVQCICFARPGAFSPRDACSGLIRVELHPMLTELGQCWLEVDQGGGDSDLARSPSARIALRAPLQDAPRDAMPAFGSRAQNRNLPTPCCWTSVPERRLHNLPGGRPSVAQPSRTNAWTASADVPLLGRSRTDSGQSGPSLARARWAEFGKLWPDSCRFRHNWGRTRPLVRYTRPSSADFGWEAAKFGPTPDGIWAEVHQSWPEFEKCGAPGAAAGS